MLGCLEEISYFFLALIRIKQVIEFWLRIKGENKKKIEFSLSFSRLSCLILVITKARFSA